MGVCHAGDVVGEPIAKLKGLVVREFESLDGACFNDVLGERFDLTAIAVHAKRDPTLPLNLHRIINVNRIVIEEHLACVCLRQWLCVIKAYIFNELLTQLRTENVPVRVDDASGRLGFRHLEYLYWESLPNTCHRLYRFAHLQTHDRHPGGAPPFL